MVPKVILKATLDFGNHFFYKVQYKETFISFKVLYNNHIWPVQTEQNGCSAGSLSSSPSKS
jgi:hypothetical protein